MSKYCPIVNRNVIYQFCEDCEDQLCRKPDKEERTETWQGIHANIIAPEGTFEKIWNKAVDEDNDI